MADYWDQQPSYTSPDYASEAQRTAARAYAEQLLKRSGGDVNRPAGALANMIDALTGNLTRNRANQQEFGMQEQQTRDLMLKLKMLEGQQAGPQGGVGASPQAAAVAPAETVPTPQPRPAMAYGNDAPQSGMFGGTSRPVDWPQQPPLSPNARVQQSFNGPMGSAPAPAGAPPPAAPPVAGGMAAQMAQNGDPAATARLLLMPHDMQTPETRAIISGLIPKQGQDITGQPIVSSPFGSHLIPQGQGVIQGTTAPITISPEGSISTNYIRPGGSGAVSGQGAGIPPAIVGGAMGTANTLRMNAAGSGAIADIKKADIVAANDAPTIKRVAGTMLNDLQTSGGQMTFGPTAEWSNNIKRIAANYAPGLMKDQLTALASADSFDKMSAQLTSLLARGGGTDAQLFNNMKSVPGAHNSKEGAEALLKMTLQVADQQMALRQATAAAQTPDQYETMKRQFYAQNPIVNPITGNPIALDLRKGGGGARIISVEPPK